MPEDEEAYFVTRKGVQEVITDGQYIQMAYMPNPWTFVESTAADRDTLLELMRNLKQDGQA